MCKQIYYPEDLQTNANFDEIRVTEIEKEEGDKAYAMI
jgi:hypothetical protein